MSGLRLATAALALAGYLTWIELAELRAVCHWCVASVVIMLALAVVSVVRLLRSTLA